MARNNSMYMTNGSSALDGRTRVMGKRSSHRNDGFTAVAGSRRNSQPEPISYGSYVSECFDEIRAYLSQDARRNGRVITLSAAELTAVAFASFVFSTFAFLA